MKQLLIPFNKRCPYYNELDHFCRYPGRSYKSWCEPQGNMNFPNFCPLKDTSDSPDCAALGTCDECNQREKCCETRDSEPVLTTDEEIDQLIIAIKALEKRFWTSENRIRCVRAAALLEDIDLDKEVNPE